MRRLQWRMRRSGLRYLVRMATGVMLLVLWGHASAQTLGVCQDAGPDAYTITMPTQLTVPRDARVGTIIGKWVSTPLVTNYYTCFSLFGFSTGVGFVATNLTPSSMTISDAKTTYTVFNTNVAGVGVAISVSSYADRCGLSGPMDLGHNRSTSTSPLQVDSMCASMGRGARNGGTASVAFVKTGPITGGTTSGGVLFQAAAVIQPLIGAAFVQGDIAKKQFSLTPTTFVGLACSTHDLTVSMGSYKTSAFTGKGSSTSPVSFNVALDDCPANMKKIQYEFDAPGGVIDTANGVIALTATSTATGIGLKLMDSSNAALKFDTQYQLSGYDKTISRSYTISLKAAYYQTAAAVTPGTANAIMTFTMTYQ